jgi:peptidoglycan/LPS O-acetylase OafA/YrhL
MDYPPKPTPPARPRFDSIDVLRGLAAFSVVVYHLWLRYFPGQSTQAHPAQLPADHRTAFLITFPIQYGYFGVTLFFVLSGFCIHLPQAWRFATTRDDGLRIGAFARQRARRLYPAYLASIVFASLVMAALPMALSASRGTLQDLVKVFGLKEALADVFFLLPFYPPASTFNGVYWTLIYELQFYAAYPVLLYAFRRFGPKSVLVTLLIIEVAYASFPVPMRYIGLSRWFEWYLGMYAAEGVVTNWRGVPAKSMAMFGLAAGVAATIEPHLWPYRDVLLSVGMVGLLVLFVRSEAAEEAKARMPWFRRSNALLALGACSYSLYLIHIPVIDLTWNAAHLAAKYHVVPAAVAKLIAPISIPTALLIGYRFFVAFERPFLRKRRTPAPAKASVLPETRPALPQAA